MKNNLTKIFSKIIPMILAIIIFIASLIIPSQVMAVPSDDQGSSREQTSVYIGTDVSLLNEAMQSELYFEQYNPKKYLFVGNSKTYYNNMPFMFQSYMKAIGKPVIVREAARGGNTLKNLWDNETVRKEFYNEYDYVVLQPKLLNNNGEEKAAAKEIVKALKSKNSNIKVIINGIWKSGNAYKVSVSTQSKMNERFRELKDEITKECGVETKISYWGQAVLRAHYTYSTSKFTLFVDDRHPSVLTSYLGVACLYSTISGKQPSTEYDGTVDNSQFKSTKEKQNNNWYYQIDKDRWKRNTTGIGADDVSKMQKIAFETYQAQNSSTPDQVEKVLHIDNSPRISIKNRDKNKGVNINITDYSGLKQEDITLYKSDKKTEINSKYYSVKAETREGVTYRLIYSLNNDFFNKKDKKIYVVAKDKNGNYNKSTFNIKWKKNNKYSIDAAPRLRSFELNGRKQISFKVADNKGIKYLKVYDVNQKDDNGKNVLVKQVKESKDTKGGKKVNIDVNSLMENKDKSDGKSHYYTIKVVSKDLNGRKCKRIINFRIFDKQ